MENVIRDICLIALGGISAGFISIWLDIKKDREKMRWEQWYRNRNKR
mgnify:FL=1|jgi:hypothetical protein|tara:strand:- start:2339 stop:2479 length:141 start_codon:yes stop_codon:yes gene_type:complete